MKAAVETEILAPSGASRRTKGLEKIVSTKTAMPTMNELTQIRCAAIILIFQSDPNHPSSVL